MNNKISAMYKTVYSIFTVLIVILLNSCSTEQPDLKMKEISLNKIEEVEKLKDIILADFDNLLKSCKQHTNCYEYHGDKCYLPANSHLLHKYLNNPKGLMQLDYLTDNDIITGNILIRSDSVIRIEVKSKQFIRGDFDAYNDTVYLHEIVYNVSEKKTYELGDFITVKSKQIKPNWIYFITKHWVD